MEPITYVFEFLDLNKKLTLQDHWRIYKKRICRKCKSPIEMQNEVKKKRTSFFCGNCQSLFKW
jgi:endonuclease-8